LQLAAALRRPGDPADYADRLLRQTWLVWHVAAPPLQSTPTLRQQSSQAEARLTCLCHTF